jgi:putative transposase
MAETRPGLWEGATENAAVCQSLLANLQGRRLRTDRSLLVILDGAQALHKATRAVFGEAALIQRCQVHKLRNILDHLPSGSDRESGRWWGARIRPPT